MIKLKEIQTFSGLLKKFKRTTAPVLILLCVRCSNHPLTDQVVLKIKKTYKVDYYQLEQDASKVIKNELQIIDNPALVIIENGQLKDILTGIVAQHQLEEALRKLLLEKQTQKAESLANN